MIAHVVMTGVICLAILCWVVIEILVLREHKKFKKALDALSDKKPVVSVEPLKAEEVRAILQKPSMMLDSTKRKSLQANNRIEVPQGVSGIVDEARSLAERVVAAQKKQVDNAEKRRTTIAPSYTPPLETPFEHKFFGTMLLVNGDVLIYGLDNHLHHMEIVDNSCYIDKKPWPVNAGDLERIKAAVRKSRE
jgi:uncharacterized protein YoxC